MAKAEKNPRFSRVSVLLQRLGLMEEERVEEEEEAKEAREEAEKKQKEEEERKRKEEEERRLREAEEARLAKEKAEGEERRRKSAMWRKKKDKLVQEIEMEERLEEEQLHEVHDKEIKKLEAKARKVPVWVVYAAVGLFLVAIVVAGFIVHRARTAAENEAKQRVALMEKANVEAKKMEEQIKEL
jgi:hypothetical protein